MTETGGEIAKGPVKSNNDIFRVLLNQETLIRSTLERNVHRLANDVVNIKENMVENKKEIVYLKNEYQELKGKTRRQFRGATKEIAALKTKNQELRAESSRQLEDAKKAVTNEIRSFKEDTSKLLKVTNETFQHEIKMLRVESSRQFKDIKEESVVLRKKIEASNEECRKQMHDSKKKYHALKEEMQALRKENTKHIRKAEMEIQALKVKTSKEIQVAKERCVALEREMQTSKQETNNTKSELISFQNDIKTMKANILNLAKLTKRPVGRYCFIRFFLIFVLSKRLFTLTFIIFP